MMQIQILVVLVFALHYAYSNNLCPYSEEVMSTEEHFCGQKLINELTLVCNGTDNLNNNGSRDPGWRLATIPITPKTSSEGKSPPDTCDTNNYDAVALIRQEVFIFKDSYIWRIGNTGLFPGYPIEITRLWRSLPRNLTRVDAVYERPDRKIVFFVGDQYYIFSGLMVEQGYPRPLLGFSPSLKKVDAAMVWGYNGKTYFFSGDKYWRFNEDTQKVELDYPRYITVWKGIGTDIDAAFQWKDGKTYFFKGKGFWKFNDLDMRVEDVDQQLSAPFWMECSKNYEERQLVKTQTTESIQSNATDDDNIQSNNYEGKTSLENTKLETTLNRAPRTPRGLTAECCIGRCTRKHLSLYCKENLCPNCSTRT